MVVTVATIIVFIPGNDVYVCFVFLNWISDSGCCFSGVEGGRGGRGPCRVVLFSLLELDCKESN